MNDYITIPLSKRGRKYAGLYEATISPEDEPLAKIHWSVLICEHTEYARNTQRELLHRIIAIRMFGEIPEGYEVDHVDGNGLNCQRDNLRLATREQNMANKPVYKNNPLGVKGVSWKKRDRKFVARIQVNKKRVEIGYFDTLEEATEAYQKAAKEKQGAFFNPNRKAKNET